MTVVGHCTTQCYCLSFILTGHELNSTMKRKVSKKKKRSHNCQKSYQGGSIGGTVVRAFTSHQRGPVSIARLGGTWAEFVGSLLCFKRFFSGDSDLI